MTNPGRRIEHSEKSPIFAHGYTVNLLNYIDLYKTKIFKSSSQTSKDKLRQFCDSIAAFPPAEHADLRMIQTRDFVYAYGQYLHTEYDKHYSAAVCDECVRRLRTLLRGAIENRELSNYDPIPTVLQRLRTDVWQYATKAQEPKQFEFKLDEEIESVARSLTWIFAKRNATPTHLDTQEARRERDEMTETRAVMVYLFGILFLGLDVHTVLTLPAAVDGEVYVERYGRKFKLPDVALELVRMHNYGKVGVSSKYLFRALLDGDTDEQVERKAANLQRKAKERLRRMGMNIGASAPLDICLTVAHECGYASSQLIESIIKASATGTMASLSDEAWSALMLGNMMELKPLHQNWYALCSYSPRLRSKKMRSFISKSGVLGTEQYALSRLYDPFDATEEPEDTGRHSISRFLFFRSTPYEAKFVDSIHTDASVLRRRTDKAYFIIPQLEIEFMQEHLRDFRDDVELINREQWMRNHQAEFVKQTKVIIHEGPFKGYNAVIVDIKQAGPNKTYYILELPHDQYTIKATSSALALDLDLRL